MLYRKKPESVDAFQLIIGALMPGWFIDALQERKVEPVEPMAPMNRWAEQGIVVHTPEGMMTAKPGDWIVRSPTGELYPVRADVFAATYEPLGLTTPVFAI